MATIWFVQEGKPLVGRRVARLSFRWCVDELALHRDLHLPTANKPFAGELTASEPGALAATRRIFVELHGREAEAFSDKGWTRGYYLVVMPATAVKRKLEARVGKHPYGDDPHISKPRLLLKRRSLG